jgi:hypothetical protein
VVSDCHFGPISHIDKIFPENSVVGAFDADALGQLSGKSRSEIPLENPGEVPP